MARLRWMLNKECRKTNIIRRGIFSDLYYYLWAQDFSCALFVQGLLCIMKMPRVASRPHRGVPLPDGLSGRTYYP